CVGIDCPADGLICGAADCCKARQCEKAREFKTSVKSAAESAKVFTNGKPVTGDRWQACHFGWYDLGRIGDAGRLWVGKETAFRNSKSAPGSVKPFALAISLLGKTALKASEPVICGNSKARSILPTSLFDVEIPMVTIEWPDYGTPDLGIDWWIDFATALEDVEGDICLYCL